MSWSQWIRRRNTKRINTTGSRKLQSEFLEPRQMLAGDVLQSAMAPLDGGSAIIGRPPQAALSLDAAADLDFEFDSNERQIASIANDAENAVVAGAEDGSYVVIRQQETSARNGWDLFGQRYDSSGARVGTMFRVNALNAGDQINPQVAMSLDGSFTVVWQSDNESNGWEVMARTFDSDGVATRTREFAINSGGSGDQVMPSVAYLDIATFVVAWSGEGDGAGADNDGIFAQRVVFNDPLGDPIRVNFTTDGSQSNPSVASTGDGNFAITWQGRGADDSTGIYVREFFVDGQDVTRTREISVNSETAGRDEVPKLTVSPIDGTVFVTWQNRTDSNWNVRGQLFNSTWTKIGSTVNVNQTTSGAQSSPSVTFLSLEEETDADGNVTTAGINDFVIVWQGEGAEDSEGIYSRRMSSAGEFAGDEVLVNVRQMAGEQTNPSIANVGTGVEIVWTGKTTTDRNGVFRREFKDAALNTAPVIAELSDELILTDETFTFTLNVTDPDNTPIVKVRANQGATVTEDETNPGTYTITPAAGFNGRINVTITAQDLVNDIVRGRFLLRVADQVAPTLTLTTGLLDSETNVREITTGDSEIRIPLTISDVDTTLDNMRVTRIVTGGDARVRVESDNSAIVVTANSSNSSEFTVIVFDGTHRVKQDVRVRFDGDAPTIDLNGGATGVDTTSAVLLGAGSQSLGLSGLNITDLNNDTITSAAVSIVGAANGEVLSVNEELAPGITATFTNGNLLLLGVDTIENYEALLRTLRYEQTGVASDAARTIELTVNDGFNDSDVAAAAVSFQRIDHIAFAQAIESSGATFYGAHWSEESTQQKELFQDGQSFLPFVEVTDPDRSPNDVATDNNVTVFPTWVFADGTRLEGLQSAETLAARAGVTIPATPAGQNSAPFIHEIQIDTDPDNLGDGDGDDVLLVGSPLYIPIDGYDADGDALTYTITSSNPDVIPTLQTGNRSMRINVDGFGDLVFEFFEDEAELASGRIIELAEDGFYEDIIFHRVLNDFVIQAGDPDGTGSGGSELDDFADQFDVDVQHNRTGLLSMAKTNDDTNNSQFFVTEGPSRHLDFNHTIFGVQTEGEAVRESISNTETVDGRPLTGIRIEDVEIFTDTENAVVQLKANEGATGTSTITVTATDAQGATFVTTFVVNLEEDTFNGGPFLANFDEVVVTEVDTPVTFSLDSIDVEGDPVFYDVNDFGLGSNATAEVDNDTGEITITPADGFSGTLEFVVGVRAKEAGDFEDPPEEDPPATDTQDRFDAHDITIIVGDPDRVFDVVERGDFDDDDLLGIRTDLVDGAPDVTVNPHVTDAVDYSDYSNPPTYGPHHTNLNDSDGNSIVPRPTGVYSTPQPDEDLVHNIEHGHVWISYNPTLISTSDLALLEALVNDGGTNAGVILTPRDANTSAIAVASWARLLEMDSFDDQQIRDFVNANRGHAPEGYIPAGQKDDDSETLDDGDTHG